MANDYTNEKAKKKKLNDSKAILHEPYFVLKK